MSSNSGGSSKGSASASSASKLTNNGYTAANGYYVHQNNNGGYTATYLGTGSSGGNGGSSGGASVPSYNNALTPTSNTNYAPQIASEQQSQLRALGDIFNAATKGGDTYTANQAHEQANKIRIAQGLRPGIDFDVDTGAMIGGAKEIKVTPGTQTSDYPPYVPLDNTALYNQQAADKTAAIRAAVQRQKTQALGNIQDIQNQYGTAIQTAQNQGAQLPDQFTQLNNQASNRGQINAQRIRTALAQMGLGQSGESASQQLQQGLDTSNQINSNNQQLQTLTNNINTQVTGLQGEQAAKIAQINQAISDAEASGDEQAATALADARAQIASEASQNAVAQNNWNLNIQDRIKAAQDAASTNAWNRGGFDSAYAQWKAEQDAQNAASATASQTDLANRIKLIQEQAKADTALAQTKSSLSGSSGGLTAYQQNQTSAKNATNNALLQISTYGSKAEALAALQQYGSDMISRGVDIQAVMDAINKRWPY